MTEVNTVLNYDAGSRGVPHAQGVFPFRWQRATVDVELAAKTFQMQNYAALWKEVTEDQARFERLRESVMKASLFMPPLYVGKTVNLSARCAQHVDGTGKANDFHNRYNDFAARVAASAREVRDLLFVCVRVPSEDTDQDDFDGGDVEGLVEHMLKSMAKPPYSKQ